MTAPNLISDQPELAPHHLSDDAKVALGSVAVFGADALLIASTEFASMDNLAIVPLLLSGICAIKFGYDALRGNR